MSFDPLVPRPIDLPTRVPLEGPLDVLDSAKILAAPDDPADWSAWRDALARWREEARERVAHDGSEYERPALEWTQTCFTVALLWLWDELLWDDGAQRFTPERVLADAERFGAYDGVVLWHAYPAIGIDERNQFDWYRDVPGLAELTGAFQAAGARVFVDYNPWDAGTRREPVADADAVAAVVEWLGADGVFLDTMREAGPELRTALPDAAFEGESTLPLARIRDHQLSWAQWFADSAVPGVIRARWFEQRHMLHHTRRWNRDHSDELQSAWLNGVGMLVWENVFGAWVGWNERDCAMLRGMVELQRAHADVLTRGEWTPLATASGDGAVYGSHWRLADRELWALVNRHDEEWSGNLAIGDATITCALPARGLAAVVDGACIAWGGGDPTYPARTIVRRPTPRAHAASVPDGMVAGPPPRQLTARFRVRETGIYGEVPYVEEWKPLPPRLHGFADVERPAPAGRFAIGVREEPVTGLTLAEARAYAAKRGARLPTEDEWQLAAEAGLLERIKPLVWNWTESEHSDGRTRFAILKGGSAYRAEGSEWYVDGGAQRPAFSLGYLLAGPLQRSERIGFRLAVDL